MEHALPPAPSWPEPAPWIALRLDWARQTGACWMIAPEDALAAWSAMPALLRPQGPAEFAAALLAGAQRAIQGPGGPLEGFLALGFETAAAANLPQLSYAEICRGRLAPPGFGAPEAIALVGAAIAQSFPRAVAYGPFPTSSDRNGERPQNHWASRIPEAQAILDAKELRQAAGKDAPRKAQPSL